jgi:hypothetical protein
VAAAVAVIERQVDLPADQAAAAMEITRSRGAWARLDKVLMAHPERAVKMVAAAAVLALLGL